MKGGEKMRLELERDKVLLVPESEMEEAYLEHILGLHKNFDECKIKRINAHNVNNIFYLEIKKSGD